MVATYNFGSVYNVIIFSVMLDLNSHVSKNSTFNANCARPQCVKFS